MKYLNLFLVLSFAFVTGCGGSSSASSVKKLQGKWVIQKEATSEYVKKSPKWTDNDEKNLPKMMEMFSTYSITFKEKSIILEQRGKGLEFPAELVKEEANKCEFKGKIRDSDVVLTVAIDDKGLMNYKSSLTDDMDYCMWKKAE